MVVGNPDQDLDGGGLETFNGSNVGTDSLLSCGFGGAQVTSCRNEDGTVIPNDTDWDGSGVVEDAECALDPRMGDGYSIKIDFTALQTNVLGQLPGDHCGP